MQHEFYMNNKREDNDLIQHKRYKHSVQNKDDEQKPMKSNTNSTYVNHKRNFMPGDFELTFNYSFDVKLDYIFNNNSKVLNFVSNEMCHNDTCIRFCCWLGYRLVDDNCSPEELEIIFPKVYTNDSTQSEERVNELFDLGFYDSGFPCQENYYLLPEGFQYDYKIFTNVIYCSETYDKIKEITDNDELLNSDDMLKMSADIVSILLLGQYFLVYSILPELRNKHGFILRNYSGALTVAYGIDFVYIFIKLDLQYPVCVTIAILRYFCFMASFFWLSIMSFDMWCTFRKLCSLQRNVRQQEKRKLIYYTIFAWGCPFMLAIFCVSMDILSEYVNVPPILRPEFYLYCWFIETGPYMLYYHGLRSICIIFSICFSISTALKIARYKKDTSLRLKNSESKCYNDNKKWFNLYLKIFIVLFIVIGIRCLMITADEFSGNVSNYNWYIINLLDIMQNLCTVIIFVWRK
ncbi:G-protein coupled receptor Mth2-like [Nylanderia fulva]|uniref:G-protein coupled receptor Mth2-like n=1 Tax=Nylanderia fulva TaxID=613905 RepID=UPI0010FADE2B|nr:G-protein coupled receptor Mth2-like [Nylanderia fulva]